MRPFIPYALLAGLCLTVVFRNQPLPFTSQPNPKNVYDSTLLMIKDFVREGDKRLGYATTTEVDSASIDFTHGLPLNYLCEDTLITGDSTLKHQLISMRRIMYPVYTRMGGSSKLCGTIVFDSTGGIHPVIIDDSTLIKPYLKFLTTHHKNHSTQSSMIVAPHLYSNVFLHHDETGDHIVGTRQLEIALGSYYPGQKLSDPDDVDLLDEAVFHKALVKHSTRKR